MWLWKSKFYQNRFLILFFFNCTKLIVDFINTFKNFTFLFKFKNSYVNEFKVFLIDFLLRLVVSIRHFKIEKSSIKIQFKSTVNACL